MFLVEVVQDFHDLLNSNKKLEIFYLDRIAFISLEFLSNAEMIGYFADLDWKQEARILSLLSRFGLFYDTVGRGSFACY